jgi:hypothetical protein
MNNKPSFWTNPVGFSIVDALAIIYSAVFLVLVAIYVKYPLESIKSSIGYLSPLIYIIVSGYFTGQAIQQFKLTTPTPCNTQLDSTVVSVPGQTNDSNMSV